MLGTATPEYSLAVWHGFNYPLLMSVIAMVGGLILYALPRALSERCEEGPPDAAPAEGPAHLRAGPGDRVLALGAAGLRRISAPAVCSRSCACWSRQRSLAALWPILRLAWNCGRSPPRLRSRLRDGLGRRHASAPSARPSRPSTTGFAALILVGGAGLVTCVTFVWLSAPDLAVDPVARRDRDHRSHTARPALAAETAREGRCRRRASRARLRRFADLAIAVACGIGMPIISYAVMTQPRPRDDSATSSCEKAYSEGGGTNVVNVILVDFRGFDTIGEITVLGIVALTVFALLRRFRPAPDSIGVPSSSASRTRYDEAEPDRELGDTLRDYLTVPSVIMQWMFPVIITARGLSLPARPRPARRRLRGRRRDVDRLPAAVSGRRNALGRGPAAHSAGALDGRRPAAGGADRDGFVVVRLSFPHVVFPVSRIAHRREGSLRDRVAVRSRRLLARGRRHRADARRASPTSRSAVTVFAQPRRTPSRRSGLMELVLSLGIGVLVGSGVWLLLRPRTYQVIIGLSLLSYAVNLFIFEHGTSQGRTLAAVVEAGGAIDPAAYADPVPQALVLTAIVIGFATTALFLVVLLASRGLTGTDHVDGKESGR